MSQKLKSIQLILLITMLAMQDGKKRTMKKEPIQIL